MIDNDAILDMRQLVIDMCRRRRRVILSELADIDATLKRLDAPQTKAEREQRTYDTRPRTAD